MRCVISGRDASLNDAPLPPPGRIAGALRNAASSLSSRAGLVQFRAAGSEMTGIAPEIDSAMLMPASASSMW